MEKEVEEEESGKIDVRRSMSLIPGLYVLDISPSFHSHFSLLVPISLRPLFLSCLSLIRLIRFTFCHFTYLAFLNDVRVCCFFLLLELHWIVRVHFDTHSLLISHTPRLGETIIKTYSESSNSITLHYVINITRNVFFNFLLQSHPKPSFHTKK